MDRIPDNVILHILSYVLEKPGDFTYLKKEKIYESNMKILLRVRQVCRRWKYLVDISELLWSKMVVSVNHSLILNGKHTLDYRCLKVAPMLGELRIVNPTNYGGGAIIATELLKYHLKKIRKLTVGVASSIEQADFSQILSLFSDQLEELVLQSVECTLSIDSNLPKLKKLYILEGWKKSAIAGRPELPNLEELTISLGVESAFYQHILGSPKNHLKRLEIDCSHFGLLPPSLHHLNFPQLKTLSFSTQGVMECDCSKCLSDGNQWNGSAVVLLGGVEAFRTVSNLSIEIYYKCWELVYNFVKCAPLHLKKVKFFLAGDDAGENWLSVGQKLIATVLARNPKLEIFSISACSEILGAGGWKCFEKSYPSVKWDIIDEGPHGDTEDEGPHAP